MSSPKAMNLLLRLKRRRVEQLEADVKLRVEELRDSQARQQEAERREQGCLEDERLCGAKMDALATGGGFRATELLSLQFVLEGLRAETQQAAKAVREAVQEVRRAQDAVATARSAVQRAQSQVKFVEERRDRMLKEIELAQEDAQDEESEEAAVARIVAAARQLDAERALEAA